MRTDPTVIGIGASAGGLAALKTFLAHVPEDSGFAIVVVVHLSPAHESHLSELLQPHVRFPVQQVSRTVPLEPNNVYVIPPNANLNAIDTHLRLSDLEQRRQERAPIDHFFRTLAAAHDGRSIAVILTGTGSDGSLGIREIKANGGLVVVQDPNEAEYDGMPQSAIATGVADLILPVAEIPAAILGYAAVEPKVSDGDQAVIPQDERVLLQNILADLRVRTDRDFSRYKPSTVLRRIARRMQLNHVDDLSTYREILRKRTGEAQSLVNDLLITVTKFFRDPDVFERLEKDLIPKIFAGKTRQDGVRVWCVGCATGEEAYSMAIILAEHAGKLESPPPIQIFASDLHAGSLASARDGVYPADIEADVGSERLARFFQPDNGGYRVRKELRDSVVFSSHNILSDPPFSRMDLISCRNLLIYLEREIQKEVIDVFHYALLPGGVLVLGTAETIEASDQFRAADKKLCLFIKRNTTVRPPRLPVFPLTRNPLLDEGGTSSHQRRETVAAGNLHQRMLEEYAPPSILVGPENRLVHSSPHAGRYMIVPGGEPTVSVLKLVRAELQLELQSSLHQAREKRRLVDTKPIPVRFNGHPCPVVMHIRPAQEPDQEGYILVIFEEREAHDDLSPGESKGSGLTSTEQVTELRAELADARRHTQTVIEEYESSREQMSAASEEMQSTNEELRSTLEELETSKEELQSINEELQTVNQQNRHKVDELAQLSGDLQNLLTATEIATLFLDRNLRILRFTPKLGDLFNVRQSDRGRPIGDLTHRLGYSELKSDAENVLSRLVPLERELKDETGRWYLTRVLPYRSTEDRIDGVVITFIDIDARKKAEESLLGGADRLRKMINVDVVSVLIFDQAGTLIEANDTFIKVSGYSKDEVASKKLNWRDLTPPEYVAVSEQQVNNLAGTGRMGPYEKEYIRKDGSRWSLLLAGAALGDGTAIEYCIDVSDRKRAERELLDSKHYSESIVETLHEPLLVLTSDHCVRSANPAFYRHFQVEPSTTLGRKIYELGNRQWDIPALRTLLEDVLPANNVFDDYEVEHTFETIGTRTMLVNARRLDHVQLILLGLRDITERKRLESEALRANRDLRLLVDNVHEYALFQTDPEGRITSWNPGAERLFGYATPEVLGQRADLLLTSDDQEAGILKREIDRVLLGKREEDARWLVRRDGSRFWAQWVTEPVRNEADQLLGVAKVLRDETERKRADERQALLIGELNHRVKNTLATVQSIASQTLHTTTVPEEFVARFQGRVHALSRAHDLLTRMSWEATNITDILREQLALDGDAERITANGPRALLPASSSLSLALVLHELGTNARKYGALSTDQGRVDITWKVELNDGDARLQLDWQEHDGPLVRPPEKAGFGSTLIQNGLRGVEGAAQLEFAPEGLRCHIQLPLASTLTEQKTFEESES